MHRGRVYIGMKYTQIQVHRFAVTSIEGWHVSEQPCLQECPVLEDGPIRFISIQMVAQDTQE